MAETIDDQQEFTVTVQNPLIYRGIFSVVQTYLGGGSPWYYGVASPADIARYNAWGCNIIALPIEWAGKDGSDYQNAIEVSEATPGQLNGNPATGSGYTGYSSASLGRLHSIINTLEAAGFQVLLVNKTCWGGTAYSSTYDNWTDIGKTGRNENVTYNGNSIKGYGADYVNLGLQPNTSLPDGKTRYLTFMKLLCDNFPTAGILPCWFPYHKQQSLTTDSLKEDRWQAYYNLTNGTQKMIYDTIRQYDTQQGRNPRLLVFEPLLQGIWQPGEASTSYVTGGLYWTAGNASQNGHWGGKTQQPYYDDPLLMYSINTHNGGDYYGSIARSNLDWDIDTNPNSLAEFEAQWSGATTFHQLYPSASYVNTEWLGPFIRESGCTTCGQRPMKETRMRWMKYCFNKAVSLNMGWTYFCYATTYNPSNPLNRPSESPINYDTTEGEGYGLGSMNEVAYQIMYYNTYDPYGAYTWSNGSKHTVAEPVDTTSSSSPLYGKGFQYFYQLHPSSWQQ